MTRILMALMATGLFFMACDESSYEETGTLGTIHGTVTLHGDWPTEGDIQISLFSQWFVEFPMSVAPQGPPDFHTENLHSPNPDAQTHLISYEIADINEGSYPSLVVGWRDGGTLGLDEPVLGMFGGDFAAGDTLPESIELSGGQDLEVNFEGWLDLIPSDEPVDPFMANVAGTVVFPDGWQDSFESTFAIISASPDVAAPSQPVSMEGVSVSDASFSLAFEALPDTPLYLMIYGFPYGADAASAFFGGYGYNHDEVSPEVLALPITANDPSMAGLTITCFENE